MACLAAACGPADARFSTHVASDFAPGHHRVSVLGVFKNGQMSADGWLAMAPRVAPAFGASTCEAAYGDALLTTNGALSAAIDDYARANGPADELVAQLAPAAKGDLVVVFTLSGQLPVPKSKAPAGGGNPAAGPAGGGGRHGRHASNTGPGFVGPDTNELDISASIFSVPLHRSVGLVSMQYYGASVDDAVAKFSDRLASVLPAAQCDGWDWTAKVDADQIRQSIDQ
jgi:hypothetical protein